MNAFEFGHMVGEKTANGRKRLMDEIGRTLIGRTATQPQNAVASLLQSPSQAGQRAVIAARHRPPREIADVKYTQQLPGMGGSGWQVTGPPALKQLSKAPVTAGGKAIPSYRRLAMEAVRSQAAGDQLRKQMMAGGAAAAGAGLGANAVMGTQSK